MLHRGPQPRPPPGHPRPYGPGRADPREHPHHGDHTHGNWLLSGATIVGHTRCREEILATGLATTALFEGVDWGEIRLAPPFVTFDERLQLHVDDMAIELVHVGPAHTTNDVVVWVPDRRLLLAGDVVFNQCTPFVLMGSVSGSLAALETLRALGAETIVPGHGPVCGPEALDAVEAYLRFVQDTARAGYTSGATPLETALADDMGPFSDWPDGERLAGNLHRAYAELRGEAPGAPVDLGAAFADMIACNGGRPPRCLA